MGWSPPATGRRYHDVVGDGRCPIADTWWQTETGGYMIVPLPGAHAAKPGAAGHPFFGVVPAILSDKGEELAGEAEGVLCIKAPWPAALRTVYGDAERFETAYFAPFPGYFFTSDGARRDADGHFWITGRVDDVVNVSGHRIDTAEVESALEASPPGLPHAAAGRGAGTRRREPSAELGPAALHDRLTTYAWKLRWWASTTR